MADRTGIAWTDATWNPVTGCTKVSPGCAHCYAETLSKRFGRSFEVTLHPERLDEPLHWRKPRRVFVCSMADLFHEQVPDEFILGAMGIMAGAPRHTFQVLTKRPERVAPIARRMGPWWPLPNVWLGTSIENDRWVGRADILRQTPAAVRFISAEPLLGPLVHRCGNCADACVRDGQPCTCRVCHGTGWTGIDLTGIDWLIIGGESGPKARPLDPQWVRDLITLAHMNGTAVFVKQMGGLRPGGLLPDEFNIREYPR
jgi:protein gp37